MFEPVHAALSTVLPTSGDELPADIQYMPPGRHRIRASRSGKPVTLDVAVDAATAETLNAFLQAQRAKAADGSDDCPFFDFNHEDREAAAWPTEFYWAGDDPRTGGVRARLEWSGAGRAAIEQKTFRRFSPTFIPDASGRVVGSETNMGGLVNRAAFKSIQPLFAKSQISNPESQIPMDPVLAKLHDLKIIPSLDASPETAAGALDSAVAQLRADLAQATARVHALEQEKTAVAKARAASLIEHAVTAGRIAPADDSAKAFWTEALLRDESRAVKALEALPTNAVLDPVTAGEDPKAGLLNKMTLQQRKLAEVRAANPAADFQSVFAKAQAEAPDLFR